MHARSRRAGTTGSSEDGGAGRSWRCRSIQPWTVWARSGLRPVSSSYRTTPSAYRSARPSTRRPSSCSGAVYARVPRISPARVSSASPWPTRPKSASFTTPSWRTMMLPGLMSRWTSPRSWMWASARAIWTMMSRIRSKRSSAGAAASARWMVRRSDPSTRSIVNHGRPSCTPHSSTRRTLGWWTRDRARNSRRKRRTTLGSSPVCRRRFIAHRRPSRVSRTTSTLAMPPCPSAPSTE